jgi:hypothetical protein
MQRWNRDSTTTIKFSFGKRNHRAVIDPEVLYPLGGMWSCLGLYSGPWKASFVYHSLRRDSAATLLEAFFFFFVILFGLISKEYCSIFFWGFLLNRGNLLSSHKMMEGH